MTLRQAQGEVMLEIDDLHVTVGGKEILKGITLSIPAGRCAGCDQGRERPLS